MNDTTKNEIDKLMPSALSIVKRAEVKRAEKQQAASDRSKAAMKKLGW